MSLEEYRDIVFNIYFLPLLLKEEFSVLVKIIVPFFRMKTLWMSWMSWSGLWIGSWFGFNYSFNLVQALFISI